MGSEVLNIFLFFFYRTINSLLITCFYIGGSGWKPIGGGGGFGGGGSFGGTMTNTVVDLQIYDAYA